MELRELKYFQAVAHCLNISRAAEQLHVSQPSVSTAIQKLEQELGVTLLDRTRKKITLSREGKLFLDRVDDILGRLDDMIAEMGDLAALWRRTLRIGVPPMIGTFLFPHLLVEFKQQHPEINLEIWEEGSVSIQNKIEQGEIDLGIIILSEASDRLQTLAVWESEIVVCLPYRHPLSARTAIRIEDISTEALIMLKAGFYNRHMIMERFRSAGIEPNILLSSSQIETIKSLLKADIGVSFLFRDIIKNDTNLRGIPLQPPAYEPIGLAWQKEGYLSRATRVFIDFILAAYHDR